MLTLELLGFVIIVYYLLIAIVKLPLYSIPSYSILSTGINLILSIYLFVTCT